MPYVTVLKVNYVDHPCNFNYEHNSLCKRNTILKLVILEYVSLQC